VRAFQIFRIVTYVVLAWIAVSAIGRLHWFFALLVTVLAISNVAVIWMLREYRPTLAALCRRRLVRKYVGWVCYFTGEQLPLETEQRASREVLLRSRRDFEIAGRRGKQIVRGHDDVIDTVLPRIYENQTLRKSRRSVHVGGPLASFLLVGQEGVGKRYLMRVISKLLYGNSAVEVFDCGRVRVDTLTGTKDREGELLEIVRQHPCTLLLFENIERASRDVTSVLIELITTGNLKQPGAAAKVSFVDATIALTTTQARSSVEALAGAGLGEAVFHQRAIEIIGEETQIDHGLLNAVTDVCFCASPSDCVKAEVVALLMKKECRDHGIELSNVDPEILATQVIQLDDASGFQLAPQRVKKLLRKPLVAAAPERPPSLSLRVRTPETAPLRN
jgi:hypothetical protein